jgi:hypothetical protein
MAGIIVQIDQPLPRSIEIGPARRIEGREGHGKDLSLPAASSRGVDRIDGAGRPGGRGACGLARRRGWRRWK